MLLDSVANELVHRLPLPVFVASTHFLTAKEAVDARSEGPVEANQR